MELLDLCNLFANHSNLAKNSKILQWDVPDGKAAAEMHPSLNFVMLRGHGLLHSIKLSLELGSLPHLRSMHAHLQFEYAGESRVGSFATIR